MNSSNNLLVRNTIIYALGDILPKIFTFITFPVLTTYLTPADYGIVNYVNTINTFLTILGFLSLNTYYLVFYFRVGDELEQKKLLGNLSIFVIGFNFLFSLLACYLGYKFFDYIGNGIPFYPYIVIGLGINFFNILPILPSALYRVRENPMPLTILNVLKGFLIMVLTLIFVIYFKFSALGVLYSNLIVSFIFGIIFFIITCKNAIWRLNWKQIKAALIFSLPLVPGSLAVSLYSIFDRILINKYLSLTDLGIYSTASTLALLLNIVSYGAYKAFEPHFFKTYGQPGFNEEFLKIRNHLLFVSLFIGVSLGVFAKEFLLIFSAESYHSAYLFVPIISIGTIAGSMSHMYGTLITARNKTKINAAITITSSIISLTLNILFLKRVGIWCAAIVYSISLLFTLSCTIVFSKIKIKHSAALISAIISIITMFVLSYFVNISNIFLSISIKLIVVTILAILISKLLEIKIVEIFRTFILKTVRGN